MVHVPKKVQKCETCGKRHPYYDGDCPLTRVYRTQTTISNIPEEFFGDVPSVFVGHHNHPKVNAGPIAAEEEERATLVQQPQEWFGLSYDKIIELQTLLVRSKQKIDVHARSDFVEENQLLALAKKPTDVEFTFAKTPSLQLNFDQITKPTGVIADLEDLRIAENVSVRRPVEYIVRDELKANEQAAKLYEKDVQPYKIMTILSSGAMGTEKRKKMVPTRWSITATDDILFKRMFAPAIRESNPINYFEVYESEYLYNRFVVLLMPGQWEFENFEAWSPKSSWAQSMQQATILQEYEPFDGRSDYADSQAGGYYASRFGVAEHLHGRGRQARAIVFREVSEKYVFPVGVWQVRENVRNALQHDPVRFDERQKALNYMDAKLDIPLEQYRKESALLGQKRLQDFLSH